MLSSVSECWDGFPTGLAEPRQNISQLVASEKEGKITFFIASSFSTTDSFWDGIVISHYNMIDNLKPSAFLFHGTENVSRGKYNI